MALAPVKIRKLLKPLDDSDHEGEHVKIPIIDQNLALIGLMNISSCKIVEDEDISSNCVKVLRCPSNVSVLTPTLVPTPFPRERFYTWLSRGGRIHAYPAKRPYRSPRYSLDADRYLLAIARFMKQDKYLNPHMNE